MSLKTVLEIEGLSDLQLTELKSTLAEFEQNCLKEKSAPSLKGESHGEPLLATVLITLTPIVLSALSLWLAKQKSRRTENFRYIKTDGKGGTKIIEFNRSDYAEGAASASSIEAFLKGVLNADTK